MTDNIHEQTNNEDLLAAAREEYDEQGGVLGVDTVIRLRAAGIDIDETLEQFETGDEDYGE